MSACSQELLGVGDRETQHPEDRVGAVGDGEPLLLGEFDRLEPGRPQRFCGRSDDSLEHDVTLAEQGQRTVCERGEVAARTERSVLGDDRRDARVEEVDHRLRDQRTGAAVAEREGAGPQEHHGPDDLVLDRCAHSGSVRPHQRGLQGSSPFGWDRHGRERAEPCRDAVLRFALGEAIDDGAGCCHPIDGRVREFDPLGTPCDGDDVVDADAGSVEVDGHDVRSSPLMRSSRPRTSTVSISARSKSAPAGSAGKSMGRTDDRDGDPQLARCRQREAHRGHVGFDRTRASGDRSGFGQRCTECGSGEVDVLSHPSDVADRPAALRGGDVGGRPAVAHREVRRFAGPLGEAIEVRLRGRRQPVERRGAADRCGDAQDRRTGGVVAGGIAIDVSAGLERRAGSAGPWSA